MKRALFIAGPTASGKSAFALEVAGRRDAVIINADSMQVYRDLPVLTACPSSEEQASAPHRLYGFLDGAQACSVAFWADKAMAEIESAWNADKLPILAGGTGMYFKVLLDGIAKIPDIPDDIRASVRRDCLLEGSETLHRELQGIDPEAAARLAPGDSQRISRAVEVFRATGTPLSIWQQDTPPGPMAKLDRAGGVDKIAIIPERGTLYRRCDLRFDKMVESGAIEEVEALVARQLSPDLPIMRALGVPALTAYLAGSVSLEAASADAKMQTRRFAKRQLTWLRNQFSQWNNNFTQYMES